MGRMYTCTVTASVQAGAVDFFEVQPADDKPVTLHAVFVSQSTELGDAAEEQIRLLLRRFGGSYTSGSGGSAGTVSPLDSHDAAFAGAVEVMNTTQAVVATGTLLQQHAEAFNVRVGWPYIPTPECRHKVYQAEALVLAMAAAPIDSITWEMTLYLEED